MDTDQKLSIYYQNCRGIRTKLNNLYMNILSNTYDIIVLTETWLIPDISNNEFIDERYVIFRKDRDRTATNKLDGGGVLIALLRGLRAIDVNLSNTHVNEAPPSNIEHLIIEFPTSCKDKRNIISAAYIPPWAKTEDYEQHFDFLINLLNDPSILSISILGDYNMPDSIWSVASANLQNSSNTPGMTCSDTSVRGMLLRNFMSSLNITQYNFISNVNNRILDLFFANTNCIIQSLADALLPPDPHHPPFLALITTSLPDNLMVKNILIKYQFHKANYKEINQEISDINWDTLLNNLPTDEALEEFYNVIYTIIKKNVPIFRPKSSKFPIWFSRKLINLHSKKQKAWVKWKKFRNNVDYVAFSEYRSIFKDTCKTCYSNYINSVEENIKNNIKHFWTYISNRKNKSCYPATMNYKDLKSSSPPVICNMFSSFFKSVFEPNSLNPDLWIPPPESHDTNILLSSAYFDECKIIKELKMLDTSKGPGPDGIPPIFLKNVANSISKPLLIIFNKSISEGIFPSVWKRANITPVHKSGPKFDIEQYRPISILSTLSKVLEKLVHNEIYPVLHNVILQQQHGFVKSRSTTSNLIIFTNYLFENLDCGTQVDAVYTDFKKAFDKVDHLLLLNKIAYNGIRGNLLRWFQSYISNRTQKIVVNGFNSNSELVTSGVPQGSILGPLLFILFINDINQCFLNSNFLLYADDLKVYRSIKSINDCILFQQDLNRLSQYCSQNKLFLSLPKCQYITFTKNKNVFNFQYNLCNKPLIKTEHLRDLGVMLDSKLCLDTHVDNVVNKAFKMYGFVIRSASEFKHANTYIYLYKTLVRSQLEYAVQIWNPFYKKYNFAIEKVQRKFLRTTHYKFHKSRLSYNDLLTRYKLLSLSSRRKYLEAVTLYNIIYNNFDCTDLVNTLGYAVPRSVHIRETRSRKLFAIGTCRTNSGQRAPIRRMTDTFNDLFVNIDIFNCNLAKFKNYLICTLTDLDTRT